VRRDLRFAARVIEPQPTLLAQGVGVVLAGGQRRRFLGGAVLLGDLGLDGGEPFLRGRAVDEFLDGLSIRRRSGGPSSSSPFVNY
jgi:hypothetical protein